MTKKLSLVMALSAVTGILVCACADDSTTATTVSCVENDVRCTISGVPQKCIGARWVDQTPCQVGQTCQKGTCVANSAIPTDPVEDKSCTDAKCKGMTDNYSGDVCISDVTVFCGCNSQMDCRTGYVCEDKICVVYEACDAAKCAAKTGTDYVGNVCIASGSDSECGCNSSTDCKTGYSCKDKKCVEKTAVTGCDATVCSDKPEDEYTGNICVAKGSVEVCGCKLSSDCRDGFECNEGTCTVASCNPVVCSKESGENYQGNVCIDSDWGTRCGCESNDDCKTGYTCNESAGICSQNGGSACDVNECAKADDYYGNACVDSEYGDQMCGCNSDSDCKSGYECDTNTKSCIENTSNCVASECAAAADYHGSACVDDGFGGKMCGCDSDSDCKTGFKCNPIVGLCSSTSSSCNEAECASASDYYGNACIDDGFGGTVCGCNSNSDCKTGMSCNSSNVCVDNGGSAEACSKMKLTFPSSYTNKKDNCAKFSEVNELSDCKWSGTDGVTNHEYTLTFKCGAVVVIKPSAYNSGMANLKKKQSDGTEYYISFSNLASGVTAHFVWQIATDKYDNNQLKVSEPDSSNSQLFLATAKNVDLNGAFTLSKSGNGLKFEHGGTASNVVSIKSISISK